jgi:general secretion pathway protein L
MVRDFFRWWFGQLADLLPRQLRPSDPTAADATVITPLIAENGSVAEIAIGLRRGGKETLLGRFALGAATALPELPRASGAPAVLRLGEAEVLGKTLTLPLAAERELDHALAFEMDRETPFKTDELYWTHRIAAADRQTGRLSVRLLLIPKARLAALLAFLTQADLSPVRAEIADGPDAGSWLPLGDGHPVQPGASRLIRPMALCCALLALAAVLIPFVQQSITMTAVDRQLAAGHNAAAEAAGLRREIQRLAGSADLVQKERDKVGQPLAILAAVTSVMPDNSYLTELELRQRKLTLSGRSAAAARLIGAFAANGEFRNPAFAAPVTRIEALHQEIFTIIAEVAP